MQFIATYIAGLPAGLAKDVFPQETKPRPQLNLSLS